MAQLVGATVGMSLLNSSSLKQHLLVFDRIGCVSLQDAINLLAGSKRNLVAGAKREELLARIADVHWLIEKGVVFEPAERPISSPLGFFSYYLANTRRGREDNELSRQELERIQDAEARLAAVEIREKAGLEAIPITLGWQDIPSDELTRADVVHLVIKELPIPGDLIPLDDVLGFRDEARSLGLVQSLRVWINEMASGKLSEVEISDKLEDLISRYDRALALEHMARDAGVFEMLVRTTADVAEGLVKFQWSKLATKLFQVRHKQIDLMKAEMTLPGREVAYISRARERFGSK